jgi:hypothetical protein
MDAFDMAVKDVRGRARAPRLLHKGFELARLNPALLPVLERIRREGLSGARVGPTLAQAQQCRRTTRRPRSSSRAHCRAGTRTASRAPWPSTCGARAS